MFLWFAALPLTSLAEITALGFTGPIFVTIGAALVPRPRTCGSRRWERRCWSACGGAMIISPGLRDSRHSASICILGATPFFSASNLISKAPGAN
jgi:drug/metabolite transporter (DMT)-like permease